MHNAIAFPYLGRTFPRGRVDLDGDEALVYVRARCPFADGDYQGVRNQRAYLQAVVRQLLSRGTLLNPRRLRSTVAAISPYLPVDQGLDSGYLAGRALRLRELRGDDLVSFTMPTTGTGREGDQSVVYIDEEAVRDRGEHLRNDTMDSFDRCDVSVR